MFRHDPLLFLTGAEEEVAPKLLTAYFGNYTGRHFETYLDLDHPNEFTAKDFLAVKMLSVEIPARAAIWLLEEGRESVTTVLSEIPSDVGIWDPGADLSRGSKAWQLWDIVRALHDVGRTKTSKLLAAKRPLLVPIYDKYVAAALLGSPDADLWEPMSSRFRESDDLRNQLEAALKAASNVPAGVSALRALDVIVWMRVHGHKDSTEPEVRNLTTPPFLI